MSHKAIILAGGAGTRLYPMTEVVSKQLLPIYDKPMIFYPLSVLMLMDIRDVLIIVRPDDKPLFEKLLGNGSKYGMSFSYAVQEYPGGLPEAFLIGEKFIDGGPVSLILGDNIFYGSGLATFFKDSLISHEGATIYSFPVRDPERFGIIEYNENGAVLSLEEKPQTPKSNQAIAGFYHFDADVCAKARDLSPSVRGELEITDLLQFYHEEGRLNAHKAPRGFAWLDTGTPGAMMTAATYIQVLEERQSLKVGCLEEIAYLKGYIDKEQLKELAQPLLKSGYGEYLLQLIEAP